MEPNELVPIYTLKDSATAEIIKGALHGEGISCHIEGESQAGFSGVFDIKILVRAEDADLARKVIESHEAS